MVRGLQSGLGLAIAVGLIGVLLNVIPGTLELEEDPGLRWLFGLRGHQAPPEQVSVIGISAESSRVLGVSRDTDEWPRSLHADLIDRLSALGAAVIVLDIMFEEPSDPGRDARLGQAIAQAGNVVLLEWVRSREVPSPALRAPAVLETRTEPISAIAYGALATAPFTLPKVPLRTSQFWTFGRGDTGAATLPAAALHAFALPFYGTFYELLRSELPGHALAGLPQTAAAVREQGLIDTARALRGLFTQHSDLGVRTLERLESLKRPAEENRVLAALIDLHGGPVSRYINYYGTTGTVRTIPYHDALLDPDGDWAAQIAGQVVFVGYSERNQPEQRDEFISVYSERSGLNVSGVEIGATAFANLLSGEFVQPWSMPAQLSWVLLFGVAVTLGLARLPSGPAIGVALAIAVAYVAVAWYRFAAASDWWPLVVPLAVQLPAALAISVGLNYRRLSQQRERIQTALGYYVPGNVLSRLLQESAAAGAARELVYGTCLVSDAEHFTSLSERIRADELGELMDGYYRTLSAAVERHGGFVADVSGDSIVAIWPAIQSRRESRHLACLAALDMLEATERFNEAHAPHRLPTGFGLDSGEVLLGNIGLSQGYQYRAVGDIVNTASRVQGLNRLLDTRVLASDSTLDGENELATRKLGSFLLVGKSSPIVVHELIDADLPRQHDMLRQFSAALEAFVARQWSAARRGFEAVLERDPNDGPSRYYLQQCEMFADARLPADWTGTIRISVK